MLTELSIRDFQAHAKLKLEFGPGVTTIVGTTDTGKSAIIRALTWVLFNQPAGDQFIRHGTKQAKARVIVDGEAIERVRGGGENSYTVGEETYVAFGAGVPEEIAKLFQVGDINVQRQHDAPFWFSLSDGEISRRLNIVINLGIIDRVMGEIAGKLSQARAEFKVVGDRLAKAKQTKKDLAYVEEMAEKFEALNEAEVDLIKGREDRVLLAQLVMDLSKGNATIKSAKATHEHGSELLTLATAWREAKGKRNALLIKLAAHKLNEEKANLKLPKFAPVQALHDLLGRISTNRLRLAELIDTARVQSGKVRRLEVEYKALHTDLHDQLQGHCPLCGQKTHEKPT